MFVWIIILVTVTWLTWNFIKDNDILTLGKKESRSISILKDRFAKGEITEEEYEEKKAILEEDEF